MEYTKRNIVDRIAVGDDCFRMEKLSDGRYRLIPAPDSVVEAGTNIDRNLLQPIEDAIYELVNNSEHPVPIPTPEDVGLVIKVQEDGSYGLGEGGAVDAVLYTEQTLTEGQKRIARENIGAAEVEIPAGQVLAGTLAGQVQANEAATAVLTVAQVRNIVMVTEDPGEGATVDYPDGTVIHVYE